MQNKQLVILRYNDIILKANFSCGISVNTIKVDNMIKLESLQKLVASNYKTNPVLKEGECDIKATELALKRESNK